MNTLFLAATTLAGSGIISLLVWILVLAIVAWAIFTLLGMLPLPAPIRQLVTVIVALVFLLWILARLGIAL